MEQSLDRALELLRTAYDLGTEPFGETFSARLRRLRTARSLSLDALAAKTGVSRAYIWKLEVGRAENPGLRQLRALAPVLGVTPGYLAEAPP